MTMPEIPNAKELCRVLAEPGGSDIALIEPEGRDPFYVTLDVNGALVEVSRT